MELVAAGGEKAQPGRLGPGQVEHQLGERRRQVADGDPLRGQPGDERRGRRARLVVRHVEAGAARQSGPDLPDRGVEGRPGDLRRPVCRLQAVRRAVMSEQVEQAAMRYRDPLGPAGRAGGVDDVGRQISRRCAALHPHRARRRRADRRPHRHIFEVAGEVQDRHAALGDPRREERPQSGMDQERQSAGVRQHIGEAVRRPGGIERQVGGSCLPCRERRDDRLGGAAGEDGDHSPRTGAEGGEAGGQPVRGAVELAVGEAPGAGHDRQGPRPERRLRLDQGEDRRRSGGRAARVVPFGGELVALGLRQ